MKYTDRSIKLNKTTLELQPWTKMELNILPHEQNSIIYTQDKKALVFNCYCMMTYSVTMNSPSTGVNKDVYKEKAKH